MNASDKDAPKAKSRHPAVTINVTSVVEVENVDAIVQRKLNGRQKAAIHMLGGGVDGINKYELLAAAIRALPFPSSKDDDGNDTPIPWHVELNIHDIICDIAQSALENRLISHTAENSPDMSEVLRDVVNANSGRKNHLPALRNATKKDLAAIKDASISLMQALSDAHKPAIDVLNLSDERLMNLRLTLQSLAIHADGADISRVPTGGLGKRPSKDRAKRVTERVAWHYVFMTGQRPKIATRQKAINESLTGTESYGPFLDFLTAIFKALRLDASPTAWAIKAREFMKVNRPPDAD